MSNTLKKAAGSIKGYFGTTKSTGLGGVIQSHNQSVEAEEVTAADENGDICLVMKYNPTIRGTIEMIMLNDETSKTARDTLEVGGTFTIPTNAALRATSGIPIIDSIEETTTNTDLARFTISYTCRPQITEMISGSLNTSEVEV